MRSKVGDLPAAAHFPSFPFLSSLQAFAAGLTKRLQERASSFSTPS